MKWNDRFPINKIFYDEWNASSWTQQAIANGLPMQAFSQTLGSFNRPTKALEVMIRNQQCVIHATPLLRWAFGNCELKFDSYGNTKPVKAQDNPTKKIDPVIALTESLAAYLFEQLFSGSEVVELEYS